MSAGVAGAQALETRLAGDDTAIVPYLTGGYPSSSTFSDALLALSRVSIAVEIGIPFSDPMADGATIQESSRVALENGATLNSVIDAIEGLGRLDSDLVVMSYLNPLLAYGYVSLLPRLAGVGSVRPRRSGSAAGGVGRARLCFQQSTESAWCSWSAR